MAQSLASCFNRRREKRAIGEKLNHFLLIVPWGVKTCGKAQFGNEWDANLFNSSWGAYG